MPRVTRVAKAQKAQGSCSKCGKKIAKGDPYIWWKFRFGGKRVRCAECPPKPSDLTQSEYLSQVYDLEERIGDINNDDPTAAISELESIADDWDALADECDEKHSNMPDALQDGDTGQLLQDRAEACRTVAEECRQAAETIKGAVDDAMGGIDTGQAQV